MNDNNIQEFGYTEMYEWSTECESNRKLGKFVTFDENYPDKIRFAHDEDNIIGVSTVCALSTSDDPEEWKYAYLCNEFGDLYLQKERLAVGVKEYDQKLELNYIRTYPWEHYIKVENQYYDKTKNYTKRSLRQEWIRVNLMGKTIVEDNGQCVPGKYCTVYSGKIKDLWGTAVPCDDNSTNKKFYILGRLSQNTILILNK